MKKGIPNPKTGSGLKKRWKEPAFREQMKGRKARHDKALLEYVNHLKSLGCNILFVDLPGHIRPDVIWQFGRRIVGEDVKTNPKKIVKEFETTGV